MPSTGDTATYEAVKTAALWSWYSPGRVWCWGGWRSRGEWNETKQVDKQDCQMGISTVEKSKQAEGTENQRWVENFLF